MKRRDFFFNTLSKYLTGILGLSIGLDSCSESQKEASIASKGLVISTWANTKANQAAWNVVNANGTSLDAVEAGARVPESDPADQSVGLGGRPDRDGNVTLDACIMDEKGRCGAVTYLKNILHPISVARKVMESTPHVMLSGEGALQFALENGFKKTNLLTENSEKEWKEWLKEKEYKPIINIENHDTIGIMAIDQKGDISGACTTSGLAFKMNGRVGDSPIIGAGLYIDNEVGGATATGLGEEVIRSVGAFLVVELMRQGSSPQEACKQAVTRIYKKSHSKDFQVGFIATNKKGEIGSYAIHPGFVYALNTSEETQIVKAPSYF